MKKTMISAVMMTAMVITQVFAFQGDTDITSRFEVAKSKIETACFQSYTNSLVALMGQLKQKGDLDGYLQVKAEKERLATEAVIESALTNVNRQVVEVVKKAIADRDTKLVSLMKSYVANLEAQLKQLMTADKIEEAKVVKAQIDKTKFELADLESKVPQMEPVADKKKALRIPADAKVYGGHHYMLFQGKISWIDAKAKCEEAGGHLVIITSRQESEFIMKNIGYGNCWIGLSRKDEKSGWRWVDGSVVTFNGWNKTHPVNGNYVRYGRWNDVWGWCAVIVDEANAGGYICEWDK